MAEISAFLLLCLRVDQIMLINFALGSSLLSIHAVSDRPSFWEGKG